MRNNRRAAQSINSDPRGYPGMLSPKLFSVEQVSVNKSIFGASTTVKLASVLAVLTYPLLLLTNNEIELICTVHYPISDALMFIVQ